MALDLAALGLSSGDSKLTASSIESALAEDDNDSQDGSDNNDENEEPITPDNELSLKDDSDDEEADESGDEEDDQETDKETEAEEEPEVNLEDEDELELAKIPKRQELKKAYPDIFKKFPALDHIIQREHAFAEVFPTVGDAKAARESVTAFNKFQSDLLNGDVEGVLSAVKQTDPKAFDKISKNFLDTLIKVDPNAHLATTQKVTKSILNYIHSGAEARLKKYPNDEQAGQLKLASEIIHAAIYDTDEVTPYQESAASKKEEDPEVEKFKTERANFEKTRFDAAVQSVTSITRSILENAVTRDIDPKGTLPPYVKSKLVTDVINELDRQLGGDARFRGLVDKLWNKARESGYSDESLKNIRTALKEKAKTVLPGIMRAKKGEAMKGLTSRVSNNREQKSQPKKLVEDTRAPRREVTSSRRDSDKLPKPGEKAIDFLMRD